MAVLTAQFVVCANNSTLVPAIFDAIKDEMYSKKKKKKTDNVLYSHSYGCAIFSL